MRVTLRTAAGLHHNPVIRESVKLQPSVRIPQLEGAEETDRPVLQAILFSDARRVRALASGALDRASEGRPKCCDKISDQDLASPQKGSDLGLFRCTRARVRYDLSRRALRREPRIRVSVGARHGPEKNTPEGEIDHRLARLRGDERGKVFFRRVFGCVLHGVDASTTNFQGQEKSYAHVEGLGSSSGRAGDPP